MIINAHDALPGRVYRVTEQIEQTIKTLELTDRLVKTSKKNVYCIDYSVMAIPPFSFPITLKTNYGETITVYDQRHFINKNNNVINQAENTLFKLTSFLQQDAAEGVLNILSSCRFLVVKGFVKALSNALVRRAGLNVEEETTLNALLVYYWMCVSVKQPANLLFITDNVARETLNIQSASLLIEDVNVMSGINDLLKEIHNHPVLFKLHRMDLKDFLSVAGKLAFSSVGNQVITAALETPCLMTALVYTILNNNLYAKTSIGMVFDPRRDKARIDEFTKTINYVYTL